MNTLEQLKRAKEGEPKAVLVLDEMPERCLSCPLCSENEYPKGTPYLCVGRGDEHGYKDLNVDIFNKKPDDCPLRKAIALIQPDGHVDYLREEETMNDLEQLKGTDIYEGAIINVGGGLFVVEEADLTTEYRTVDCSSYWRECTLTIKCHGLEADSI